MVSKHMRHKYANVIIEKKRKQDAIQIWQQQYDR